MTETVTILLVDDDDIDAESLVRGFRRARIANPIERARDGEEALGVLRGGNGAPPLQRPYLLLVDLNMPRMNGFELLGELRRDPLLRDTIVFVLTTSDDDLDKLAAYSQKIAGYVVKDRAGQNFLELVGMLDLFWTVVAFPPLPPSM